MRRGRWAERTTRKETRPNTFLTSHRSFHRCDRLTALSVASLQQPPAAFLVVPHSVLKPQHTHSLTVSPMRQAAPALLISPLNMILIPFVSILLASLPALAQDFTAAHNTTGLAGTWSSGSKNVVTGSVSPSHLHHSTLHLRPRNALAS